jgi:hypothetical protein
MSRRRGHRAGGTTVDGFPGYVRGWVCKARDRSMQRGYKDVGYLLCGKIRLFRPAHIGVTQWFRHVGNLQKHVMGNNRPAVQDWFRENYPALMLLIPERRHREFVAGLMERAREERNPCR